MLVPDAGHVESVCKPCGLPWGMDSTGIAVVLASILLDGVTSVDVRGGGSPSVLLLP